MFKDLTKCSPPPPSPAAPPSYCDLAISEAERRDCLQGCDRSNVDGDEQRSLLPYITEFRYLPPPLYSEVQRRTHVWISADNGGDGNIELKGTLVEKFLNKILKL